jgi:hypothetical protein
MRIFFFALKFYNCTFVVLKYPEDHFVTFLKLT